MSSLWAFAIAEDWVEEALCAQTDPEIFFPEKGGSTRDPKAVCSRCSVRAQCLQYAVDHNERFGIWGGGLRTGPSPHAQRRPDRHHPHPRIDLRRRRGLPVRHRPPGGLMSISRQSPRMLPLDDLIGHRQNVRTDVGDLTELAASIRQHGIIQPIVVTEHPNQPGKYLIRAGHRRAAAAATIPLAQVVCIVRHDAGTADDHVALMLVENMQRSGLSPVEKARAMQKLIDHGATQTEVAKRIGITPASVNNYVMLLDLSDDELEEIEEGHVRLGDARAAVKTARASERIDRGSPVRGRPAVVEPAHFTKRHPLAPSAEDLCDHTQRPRISREVLACGQCWEAVIRADVAADLPTNGGQEVYA